MSITTDCHSLIHDTPKDPARCRRAVARRRLADGVASAWRALSAKPNAFGERVGQCLDTIETWLSRHRGRRQLAGLDDRILADIGHSRADALREATKPFWRP